MKKIILFSAPLLVLLACKKKNSIKDCEKNNYAVVTITFTDNNIKHSILITTPGSASAREKRLAKGITSDTLHLAPNSWPISFSSLDDKDAAIDQTNKTVTTSQCADQTVSIAF